MYVNVCEIFFSEIVSDSYERETKQRLNGSTGSWPEGTRQGGVRAATTPFQALFGSLRQLRHTIPEKRIFNAWSTKRSLFAKPFHGWV